MPEETAPVTLDQAFEAAVTEHKPAEEVKEETAGETESGEETEQGAEETEKVADQLTETTEETLLSKEEADKLSPESKTAYKAMQKAFTQKTQKLAEERKGIEKYQQLIDSFEADPKATIKKLAEQSGLTLVEAAQAAKEAENGEDPILTEVKKSLGPDLEFLAERVAPMFQKLYKDIAEVKSDTEAQKARIAQVQAEDAAAAMTKEHPDWMKHAAQMNALSKKLQPAGMDQLDYLKVLYKLVAPEKTPADQAKKIIAKLQKSAESSESNNAGVSDNNVQVSPGKLPSIDEAYAAAQKGVRWEE